MEKIKQPRIKGVFYPKEEKALREVISKYQKSEYNFKTRAVIVPHAGLVYSGALAYQGLSLLDKDIGKVFIFAPAHKLAFKGIATSSYDYFETPLRRIEVDKVTVNELIEKFGANYNDEALEYEHSIEVELPLIQSVFDKDIKIIPVLISSQSYGLIADIIENYYDNKEYGFVISSDLSHFLHDIEAKKLDSKTADMIETGNLEGFEFEQACGAVGICGLVHFANKRGYSLIRIGMMNSGDIAGDKTRVVGYGAWGLYENSANEFLKEYYSDFIMEIAKKAVKTADSFSNLKYPPLFNSKGAVFVTLEKNNNLRGCIGSIIAHRPLIEDLIINARNSAYNDPRFKPVNKDEFDELTFAISILSAPIRINFKNEDELLEKIEKDKDGIIIRDIGRQAVYLPCVWEQLPEKKQFLNSLKVKAGLPPDYFSESFQAYKFSTVYIK